MNERIRTNNKYNLNIYDEFATTGFYNMPVIQCDDFIPERLIPFNYAKTAKDNKCGLHFYLDDYQFERIWNDPLKYIGLFKRFECILSPDFSLYYDMPIAMQIWNTYRSRMVGQFYQTLDIKVIPTISWSDKRSYEFCFDGIPEGSIVSVSSVGVMQSNDTKKVFVDGLTEMIKRIKPKAILFYGKPIEYDYGDIEVVYYENNNTKRLKQIKKEK